MKKLFPILLFLLSCCHVALSQDYPVQVTTIVTPPYSLYLSDYASPESNTLQVMLQLKELDRPEYRVKLRITIEGQGISLRTKATFVPRAIVLQGGVPEMLTGADLSAYLNPNNMDFLGTTQQAFMRTGMFPEGFYTFKVEVLDYVRNVVVSNAGVGNAFIILNDPPLINLPFNNDKVVATDPQNIIFSWTPRHTASPNAAFSTEYEFTLVELYPENRNPNDAIRAANSIYTTTTSATSLNYGILEPLLIPGRKYAFRIRAYDVSGKDLFKNNGYSEVNVFQFGDACVAPLNVKADPLDPVRIKFSWEQQDVHTSYSLEFRKEGTSTWEQQNIINDAVIVPGLQGSTTYEYRVQGQCGSIQGPFSTLATVITPASDTSAFVCGAPVPEIEINTTPLDRDLRLLDIIKTADFEVIITDLTANGDGSYKGTGRAMVPWFKLAGIRVKFSDIKVNQDLRVFSGNVTTIYSKDSRFVLSADLSSDDPEAPDTGSPTAPPAFNGMDTVLTVPITNVTIPSGNNTVIVVTTPTGQTFEIPRERNEDGTFRDTRITDANGDTWTVSSGGDIQRGPNVAPPPAYASRDSVNFRVNFAALENQYYGFDSKHFQEVAEDKININGEDYWIAWKSVETGRQDYVSATASGQTTFPPKVGFKTSNGPALHETGSSAAFRRVSVMGLVDQQVEALTAYVRVQEGQNTEEVEVGRLNVKAYDKVQKKVIVVPVNNASVPAASAISEQLNKIYAQAVVGWEVIVEPSITVDETVIQNLDAGVSDMLSSFPENMLSFVRTFRNDVNRFIDGDAYYIFMVNNPNAGREAFMPFNRKFGFVYTNKSTNVITTLAHELGHGAFNLRHTFSPEAMLAAKGTTDNLMDYNNGTKIKKYQWDLVRNQETINGWFEDDSESQKVTVLNIEELAGWEYNNVGYAFLAPSGEVLLLPKTVKSITFSTGDLANSKEANVVKVIPFGTVTEFNIDGVIYKGRWNEEENTFTRYASGDQVYKTIDFISSEQLNKPIDKVIVGTPVFINDSFVYYTYLINNTYTTIEEIKNIDYRSRGSFQSYDFLSEFLTGNSNLKVLSAPPSFVGNQGAVEFVKYYLQLDPSKNQLPTYGLYLYTHATLLDRYGLLQGCFATGLPGEFLRNIKKFTYTVEQMNYRFGYTYDAPQSISFPEDFELNNETKIAFDYLMSSFGSVDLNYYKELEKLVTSFKSLIIPIEMTEDQVASLLNAFSVYQDLGTDNFNCIFTSLSVDNKRNLLKHLLNDDTDDWANKYEKITLKILQSLTEEEISEVFIYFKENPSYLYNAYNKMDNLLNSEYIFQFMYGVLKGWQQSSLSLDVKYPEYSDLDLMNPSPEDLHRLVVDKRIILLEDEKFFTGTESDQILHTGWNNETYKINISQSNDFVNSYGMTLVELYGSLYKLKVSTLLKGNEGKTLNNLNPLDPVLVFISSKDIVDLGLQGLNLNAGVYAIPAILIHWINTTQKSEIKQFYLRIALDGLAISLAPFTGGTSVALITIEIALPAADIALTLTKEQMSQQNDSAYFRMYQYWDAAYMAYGAVFASIGLIKSAPSIVTGVKNTMRLIANPKVAGRLVRERIEGFNVKQFANKIDEMAGMLGSQWANYAIELRKLATSIRINAELRYAITYTRLEGFINPNNDFLISNSDVYSRLFKYQNNAGTHYASEIRFLKNSSNVKRVRFAGELENIKYTDDTQELSGLLIVEDVDNTNSFFVVTQREMENGVVGIQNYDDLKNEWRIFKGLEPVEISIRGTTPTRFKSSFEAPQNIKDHAWVLFKEENYNELQSYFVNQNINKFGNTVWPPNNGFSKILQTNKSRSEALKKFDRFQSNSTLSGSFSSPVYRVEEGVADLYYTFDSRMLNDAIQDGTYYFEFSFGTNVDDFDVIYGDVMPWFNNANNIQLAGEQVQFSKNMSQISGDQFQYIRAQVKYNGEWRKCVMEGKSVLLDIQSKINRLPKNIADELVDYLNARSENLNLFKRADLQDKLIESWIQLKKVNQVIPDCK